MPLNLINLYLDNLFPLGLSVSLFCLATIYRHDAPSKLSMCNCLLKYNDLTNNVKVFHLHLIDIPYNYTIIN